MLCARCLTACFARLAADLIFAMVIPESIQKNNLLMHNLPIHSLRREAKSRLGAWWREARFAICYLLFAICYLRFAV
jgi:hypothetical protein